MLTFIRKHPVASYFVLAFALSWSGIVAIVGRGPLPAPPADAERLFVWVYLAMLVGPPVAGVTMTAVVSGRSGLRDFRARFLTWRVPVRWYAIALLTAPLVLSLTLVVLSRMSSDFAPAILTTSTAAMGVIRSASRMSLVFTGLLVGLGAGLFEELGWTGFATPTMRARTAPFPAGLVIGIAWGAWHFLAILWGSGNAIGSTPIPLYLTVALFSFLPPYRVLMTMVFDQTRSTLVAVLMHASLTASMIILGPAASASPIAYDLTLAAVLWVVVGVSYGIRPRSVTPAR